MYSFVITCSSHSFWPDLLTTGGKFMVETGGSAGYSCLVTGALKMPSEGVNGVGSQGGILFESLGSGNIAFAKFPATF